MATRERPLSPHLQVYRWQITMTMSILHRVTGVGLTIGARARRRRNAALANDVGSVQHVKGIPSEGALKDAAITQARNGLDGGSSW